ncbi:hypothetical protein [Streptomyces roseolilacinus]|uniref:hypothetical protein n=1 Tax=Streptomyces roseolilacinus TaxID=66904 RepID=UPI0038256699
MQLKSWPARALTAAVAALALSAGAPAGAAQADSHADARTRAAAGAAGSAGGFYWKCTHKSAPSRTDPGGRDAWINYDAPNKKDRAGMRFTADGEIITVWNNSRMAMEYEVYFQGTKGPIVWRWILEAGGRHHTANLSIAEGHKVQMSVLPWQITLGSCVDNGGRT